MKKLVKRIVSVGLCLAFTLCLAMPSYAASSPEEITKKGGGKIYVTKLAPDTYMFDDDGISTTYLLIGQKKCLCIDSGVGKKEFRQTVEQYAQGKPVEVALTHSHVDHAGAVGQFDILYMNKADLGISYHQDLTNRKIYGYPSSLMNAVNGYGNGAQNIGDLMSPNEQLYYLGDGDVIDLGGRTVTYYWTPGHTPGSGVYIDSATKYMFTGDIANPVQMNYWLESTDLTTYLATLEKIRGFFVSGQAAKAYNGHETSYKQQKVAGVVITDLPGENTTLQSVEALIKMTNRIIQEYQGKNDPILPINEYEIYTKADGSKGIEIMMTTSNKINLHSGGSLMENAKDYSTGLKAK